MKRQKNEDFDECSQVRSTIEKNGRREKLLIQNKCGVSSQKHRSKKRRGRHCRGVSPTFPHSGLSRAGRTGSVLPWRPSNLQRESPINYHKCPNYETPTFRHLIGPPKQMTNTCKEAVEKAEAKRVAYKTHK